MLHFALESVGWGSERCDIERPPGGRATMRERHRPISLRLVHAPQGLRRQGRRERRTLRSRRVGEDWTVKVSIEVFDVSISTQDDGPLLIRQRQAQNPRASRRKRDRFPRSTCGRYFILVLSPPSLARLDNLRVSSISFPTVP